MLFESGSVTKINFLDASEKEQAAEFTPCSRQIKTILQKYSQRLPTKKKPYGVAEYMLTLILLLL